MRILCEISWIKDEQPIDGETIMEKDKYWILHYGLDYRIIELGEDRIAAVNFTVIICQNCKTGQIEKFLPEQCRILGPEVKE